MGVYSSDSITKYINFYDIIKERRAKYPFATFNTEKDLSLFDSFGFSGFKQFIVDNDIDIIDKLLYNFKKFNKKDTKLNLVTLTFSVKTYKKIKEKNIEKLTNTAKRFFPFII